MLAETFIDAQRFAGTCYRAANWIHVGTTQGRGNSTATTSRHYSTRQRRYLKPLHRAYQAILTATL